MKKLTNAHTSLWKSLTQGLRRWRHPELALPVSCLDDEKIDCALKRAGIARKDLFTPGRTIARYRSRMAAMLAMHGIDVEQAVRNHWPSLKDADGNCARCRETGRCTRWLEWGRPNAGPKVFCPNAALFSSIEQGQVEVRLRANM